MTRIDVLRGGVTGVKKMAAIAEAYGIKCEVHMSGFANLQLLGSTSEDVCEYYERGLVAPGVDCNDPPPYSQRARGSARRGGVRSPIVVAGYGIRYKLGLYKRPSGIESLVSCRRTRSNRTE